MNIIKTNFNYRKPLIPLDLNKVQYIILHHVDWVNVSAKEIHDDVLADPAKKDWSGFPYGEYIRKDGTVYIGRGDNIGAQCQDMNSISYGIAVEGDYNKELLMPEVQKLALVERIKYNMARFPNYQSTVPHWQFINTSCPGQYYPLKDILKRIEVINVVSTIDEAIQVLLNEKAINSADYRKKVCDVVNYEKEFVITIANILLAKNKLIELSK